MTDFDDRTRPTSQLKTSSGSSEFLPGQMLNDRYKMLSRLGQGGMGVVYKVHQVLLSKDFALKTIEQGRLSPVALRRFQQEAKAAFALDHPNIISVNDFGTLPDGSPFLVMELVNGESLSERIKRAGAIPWEEAVPIFVQICFGLAYAHECGIVHRDIKPGNIMLLRGVPEGSDGSIKILDFGIAKLAFHEGGEIQALTRTGEIFGSPMYMSPEQCSGLQVDHRADIYSLGCVFYEALTGAPPCVGDNALSTMMKHQSEIPMSLKQASMGATFPQGLEDIIAFMLAKSPELRYQSLGQVANNLGAVKRGGTLSLTPENSSNQQKSSISMSTQTFCLILFGVILLTVAITEFVHVAVSRSTNTANQQDETSRQGNTITPHAAVVEAIETGMGAKGFAPKFQGLIKSKIAIINGKEVRQFLIPDQNLGYISNLNYYGQGPGKAPPYFKWSAESPCNFPPEQHLTLEVGGNLWSGLSNTDRFKQIDKNDFYGLMVTGPKLSDQFVPVKVDDLKSVRNILDVASTWNNLATVFFQQIPIDESIAQALDHIPKLKDLSIVDSFSTASPSSISQHQFLRRLNFLQLHCSAKTSISVDEILKTIAGSKALKRIALENIELTPTSIGLLSRCPNLTVLWLGGSKLNHETVERIADIKSLCYVLNLTDATITPSQLEWLSSRRKDLKFKIEGATETR